MPRYRRIPLNREKSLQAALTSVVVGAGAAAVTYVIARLMLQRDPLLPSALPAGDSEREALEAGISANRALGPGDPSPSADRAGVGAGDE